MTKLALAECDPNGIFASMPDTTTMPVGASVLACVASEQEARTARGKSAVLEAFGDCGCITEAARVAGVGRRTHYLWMHSDDKYALAWLQAREGAIGLLEDEAKRRAVEGVPRQKHHPKTGKGYIEQHYSDLLLIFLLKAWKPETYGDKRTGNRQMNINVVNTAAAAPAEAPASGDTGVVPEQRVALSKLRAMLADEGLLPNRQRRALVASGPIVSDSSPIDVLAEPSVPAGEASTRQPVNPAGSGVDRLHGDHAGAHNPPVTQELGSTPQQVSGGPSTPRQPLGSTLPTSANSATVEPDDDEKAMTVEPADLAPLGAVPSGPVAGADLGIPGYPRVSEAATISEPDDDEKAIMDHFGPPSAITAKSEAQTSPVTSATVPDGPKVGPDPTPHGVTHDEREPEGPDPG